MDKNREALDKALLSLEGSKELVNKWWRSPNKNWGGDTPEAIYLLKPDDVINYILKHYQP